MKLLALDTSSDACSAAVLTDAGCYAEFTLAARAHTRLILPMVESVLQQAGCRLADLDAIAFGRGPGAFTGIRIATGVVQGLALAANKPVLPVSTLAALALQAHLQQGAERVLVAIDARMGEVYWGEYCLQDGCMQLQGEEQVLAPEDAPWPVAAAATYQAIGSGWAAYADTLLPRFAACLQAEPVDSLPAAEFIAQLAKADWLAGKALPASAAQPVYLRNKIAQTIRERAISSE